MGGPWGEGGGTMNGWGRPEAGAGEGLSQPWRPEARPGGGRGGLQGQGGAESVSSSSVSELFPKPMGPPASRAGPAPPAAAPG